MSSMEKPPKPVEVRYSKSAEEKLNEIKGADSKKYELIKRELRRFFEEYPDTVCANVRPSGKDGWRKFVADNSRAITFSGIGQETPDKHILFIHQIIL